MQSTQHQNIQAIFVDFGSLKCHFGSNVHTFFVFAIRLHAYATLKLLKQKLVKLMTGRFLPPGGGLIVCLRFLQS